MDGLLRPHWTDDGRADGHDCQACAQQQRGRRGGRVDGAAPKPRWPQTVDFWLVGSRRRWDLSLAASGKRQYRSRGLAVVGGNR